MSDDTEDEETDPVDALAEEASDREGDPFDSLAEGAGPESGPDEATGTDGLPEDPAALGQRTAEAPAAEPAEAGSAVPDRGPAERVGDPFAAVEGAFEEMDIGDLDDEQVWETLGDAQSSGSVTESGERTIAEVSKHSYCETCRYFSGPPEIHCTHEGTEILEFPDLETVRVVDCPIVAERRELQDDN